MSAYMKFRVLSLKQRRARFVEHHRNHWTPFFAIWPRRIDSEHLVIGRCVRILKNYDIGSMFPCAWKYRTPSDHAAAKLKGDPRAADDKTCPVCGYIR